MAKVKLAYGSKSEKGTIYGVKGDQYNDDPNKAEVKIGVWWDYGQNQVFRAKDEKLAEKIATIAEDLANNPAVGYSQYDRRSLWAELEKLNWDWTKLTTPCNCDCSSLVCVILKCCGIDIGNNRTCLNLLQPIKATGLFKIGVSDKYTREDSYLMRGDIVNASNTHVTVALTNGSKIAKTVQTTPSTSSKTTQTKTTTTTTTTEKKETTTTTTTKSAYTGTFPTATISPTQGKAANIKRLQAFLNWYGKYNLKLDGVYGPKSIAAVKDFQTKENLEVDGIVGPKTIKAMKKVTK